MSQEEKSPSNVKRQSDSRNYKSHEEWRKSQSSVTLSQSQIYLLSSLCQWAFSNFYSHTDKMAGCTQQHPQHLLQPAFSSSGFQRLKRISKFSILSKVLPSDPVLVNCLLLSLGNKIRQYEQDCLDSLISKGILQNKAGRRKKEVEGEVDAPDI